MNDTGTDSAKIFAPIWRRKWLILAVAILVAAGTYEYYKRKPKSFVATTQLYLGPTVEQPATGEPKAGVSKRVLSNQADLINSPIIGEAVHNRLRTEHLRIAGRGTVKASSKGNGDFISISAKARTPHAAVTLANDYAEAYIAREKLDYLRNVRNQIVSDRGQLLKIEEGAVTKGAAAGTLQQASLDNKIAQLESDISSFTAVQQVSAAKAEPLPVGPSPKKNAIFGFVIGLLLASIAAYALSRLDRRLRGLSELEGAFHSEILVALPTVKAPLIRPDGRRVPARPLLEPLRRLHTLLHLGLVSRPSNGSRKNGQATLQLGPMLNGARQKGPKVLLFLSSDAGDGRSTLIASLAHVQRDAGARVVVVEADFRRPAQAKLLDVPASSYGLAQVLTGEVTLEAAMQTPLGDPAAQVGYQNGTPNGVHAGNGHVGAGNGHVGNGAGNGAASSEAGNGAVSGEAGNGAVSGEAGNGAASTDGGNGAAATTSGNGAAAVKAGNGAVAAEAGNGAVATEAGNGAVGTEAGNGTGNGNGSTAKRGRRAGSLSVLLSGGEVSNPPALLASEAMSELLHRLGEEYDCVLIDVPPPPEVSDAMALLPQVDGIVLLARLGHTRLVSAKRLEQLLGRTPSAPVLGTVANCVPRKEIEAYGFSFAPVPIRRSRIRIAR